MGRMASITRVFLSWKNTLTFESRMGELIYAQIESWLRLAQVNVGGREKRWL